MAGASDHPDAFEIHRRLPENARCGIATVYRTLKTLPGAGIVTRHEFDESGARYEIASDIPHPHLIDVGDGKVVELEDDNLAQLLEREARRLGYRLVNYRLKLFAVVRPA